MSALYTYPYSATWNGEVNGGILRQEILTAGTVPGLEWINTIDLTSTIEIIVTSPLTLGQEVALDALVASHVGVEYADRTQTFQDLSVQSTATSLVALSESLGPLIPTTYRLMVYAEIRIQSQVAGAIATVSVSLGGVEVATDTHEETNEWEAFSTHVEYTSIAGADPIVEVELSHSGTAATVEIRRIQVDFATIE